MKSFLAAIAVLIMSTSTMAQTDVQNIVDDYYTLKLMKVVGQKHDTCYPTSSCFKVACDSVGTFECDDEDEMNVLRKACRGVWGGDCITKSKKYLGQFEYDDNEEMAEVVNSCRGLYDLQCVDYTCNRLGRFGCDDREEITRINRTCAGY
ncbi:MAG: hypothetical protein KC493_08975 [Bacteriovoracaceae bacterium]|nr:hypothetical protein [Bacteriovoracaceae bacterium]